jgi:hypothetical protein
MPHRPPGALPRLCLCLEAAHAEWAPIDGKYQSPGLRMVYIDPASVRRDADLVTLTVLIDWKSMQGGRSPTRFYSTTLTIQFDCREKRARSLATIDFYNHMGTGPADHRSGYTNDSPWVKFEPESLNQGLWETVCGNTSLESSSAEGSGTIPSKSADDNAHSPRQRPLKGFILSSHTLL